MQKMAKRVAIILLVLAMVVTTAPIAAMGASVFSNIFQDDLVWGDDELGITRAEWLHNLVVIFEMEIEEEYRPDNYFSDLDIEHPYYDDILLAVEFGVVDVGAGYEIQPDIPTTRDFAASTLNFCLGFQLEADSGYTYDDAEESVDPVSAQVALNRGWFVAKDNSC